MKNIENINEFITTNLFELQDLNYREFHSKLMPDFDKSKIIGVRTPYLKDLAKTVILNGNKDDFINSLPHKYYEENNLHSFIINREKDFEKAVFEVERFLPYVDNWATCDGLDNITFEKNKLQLLPHIFKWIDSNKTYTVRFGILMLMKHFLGYDFKVEYANIIAKISSSEYYVNMMIAWYFATALAKNYDQVIHIIEEKILPPWTHNKTIQKAVESYRITTDKKQYLKLLKIK